MTETHYIHGTDPDEQKRLSRLNDLINQRSLTALALEGGERVLDVGSGLGQLSRGMALAAGPQGRVIGIERSKEQLARAQELAHEIVKLPQGAIRADKESVMRHVGRTLDERLRLEAEMTMSMWMRRDSHTLGASAFKERRTPEWPHHGL